MAMKRLLASLSAVACASLVIATAIPGVSAGGALLESSTKCEHEPTSRQCWGDYDVNTDYMDVTPDTGVTREVCGRLREHILA